MQKKGPLLTRLQFVLRKNPKMDRLARNVEIK